jgi:hypothetical protein
MSMHVTHYFVTCPKMVVWISIFINNHHHRHPTMTSPTLSLLDAYIGYSHILGGNHDLLVGLGTTTIPGHLWVSPGKPVGKPAENPSRGSGYPFPTAHSGSRFSLLGSQVPTGFWTFKRVVIMVQTAKQ